MPDPTIADSIEVLKPFAQFGVVGLVAYLLGKRFLQQADEREKRMTEQAAEDRAWIRNTGENQMILLKQMSDGLTTSTGTNKELVGTNSKLVEQVARLFAAPTEAERKQALKELGS